MFHVEHGGMEMRECSTWNTGDSGRSPPMRSWLFGREAIRERKMSREQKIAAVEAYLNCFSTKDLSGVPFAEDVTFEGPRMPKMTGRSAVLGFLSHILPMVRGIRLKQHISEGDYVVSIFDMETVNGVDHVCDCIQVADGQIKSVHIFYYPEQAESSGS
jgi:hypothetical protein